MADPTLTPAPANLMMNQTNQQQQATVNNQANSNINQQPIFTAGQQQLQGQATDLATQLMTGQTGQFGLPQATRDAAWYDFRQNQLPVLAQQNGVGSPALNSAAEQLNLRLAGLSGQTQTQNATNLFNSLGQYAFNPVGTNQQTANTTNQATTAQNSGTSIDANPGGALGDLTNYIGNLFNF